MKRSELLAAALLVVSASTALHASAQTAEPAKPAPAPSVDPAMGPPPPGYSPSAAPPPVAAPPLPIAAPSVVVAPPPAPVVTHPAEEVDVPKKTQTDHEKVVGRFGMGYFGQYDVPLGFGGARSAGSTEAAQMIGLRYWWPKVRLDVSFGWNMGSGTQKIADRESDQASTLVFAGRIALPFALFSEDHYTFFLGPEIAFGHAGETVPAGTSTATTVADTTHKGDRFTLGGRAGAEVQFGFIGVPRLALDATISLALDFLSGSTSGPSGPSVPGSSAPSIESSFSRTQLRSSVGHQPWNIFVTNVAAVYYF